ncbi:hypothetical protein PAXRUDRAFT_20053 [Paxillus rubicundulus Ve08.2h10]|uniref:Uncharacterized protein n=1 Tax=Paxillus rubicundulus Ve08.2h10 TaxID=930991 RepID=A0A0D0BS05_9AGAM|nr:hypothetical protein PAXRUDRAFT_20053 [Paxillus rubicundulus Ve08.2h10]
MQVPMLRQFSSHLKPLFFYSTPPPSLAFPLKTRRKVHYSLPNVDNFAPPS